MTLKNKTLLIFSVNENGTMALPSLIAHRFKPLYFGEKIRLFNKQMILVMLNDKNLSYVLEREDIVNEFDQSLGNAFFIHCIITTQRGLSYFEEIFGEHENVYIHSPRPTDSLCELPFVEKICLS